MRILGIETSCDETSVALLDAQPDALNLEKHVVSSQVDVHRQYGGVVPEVAARMHLETLQPLLDAAIGREAICSADLIAVTAGPGLITSLMVGVQAAKTLSFSTGIPLVGVNHLEGHVYANWLTSGDLYRNSEKYFPAVVLIVSGGHTQLLLMRGHGKFTLLGETLDDAAGEAFDKVAKILDLGYPGGPRISKLATTGNPHAIDFPQPLLHSNDYMLSFSGLKTAVLYYLERKKTIVKESIPDIVASFQRAVVEVLTAKARKACEEYTPRSLILCGGVSANEELRKSFGQLAETRDIPLFVPSLEFTGDNAAMIAVAGYYHRKQASRNAWKTLSFDPTMHHIV